jgi:hypothetical protein
LRSIPFDVFSVVSFFSFVRSFERHGKKGSI